LAPTINTRRTSWSLPFSLFLLLPSLSLPLLPLSIYITKNPYFLLDYCFRVSISLTDLRSWLTIGPVIGQKDRKVLSLLNYFYNGRDTGDGINYRYADSVFPWDGLGQGRSSEFLSEDQLVHLKTYRYQSVDKSLISRYILKHYVRLYPDHKLLGMGLADGVKWNFMVELLPRWLAPNAVTLIGFGFILTNVICLEIWLPDLVGPGPSWLYYSFAFGLWACVGKTFGRYCRAQRADYIWMQILDHGQHRR